MVVPVYWLPGRGWLLLIQSSSVFEQSSCVCVFEQSRVFEQSEPRNAYFVHTARCQFALSQAAVLCSGLALYLWRKCFIHDEWQSWPLILRLRKRELIICGELCILHVSHRLAIMSLSAKLFTLISVSFRSFWQEV